MDSDIYKIRKWITDIKAVFSGTPSRIVKRFLIIKPLYKLFMKFIRKL
ncbi:hypothetical protein GGP62_003068 [Salinibacter ruber]|jgi:hypothetical protein|nr:hypothetical protein [Salinibacter ruber]MCS3708059.1 hypothetical protein [Salinibacter ruber]MCS3856429.1 hypothetical protein [Salinibacter ruber]MCS4142210.1 hypothetical protein [Salinibacter ruber]MCS4181582.1 hypothetical protein [Salinibacter ruber]